MSFSLGIIVNELLSNIMKYAFKDKTAGIITINASKKEDSCVITIRDDGVGIPKDFDMANSGGFGMSLIKMMTEQIRGKIRAERHNGTKFTLEFKV